MPEQRHNERAKHGHRRPTQDPRTLTPVTSKKNTLKHRFMGAMGWTLFGFVFGTVLRLGSSLILTRLLAPDLYGVMAVGYMVITALTMVSDIGLVAGAMQSRNGERPIYLNVTWVVAIARGGLLMALAL